MWLVALLVGACGVSDGVAVEDERDAQFSITTTSGEEMAVLAIVNTAATSVLDEEVPLDRRAAENIVAHRDGADGIYGTSDDDPFDDLAELDAIPYVGPKSLEKLIEFSTASDPE